MSHRWNCPTDYEARREGERAYEYGNSRSSNPYEDSYWNRERACREAEEEWDRGYRWAEMRAEEAREEEAARQRAAIRRAEESAYEDAIYEREQYYAMQQERELAELDAAIQAEMESAQSADAVDPHADSTGKPPTRDDSLSESSETRSTKD